MLWFILAVACAVILGVRLAYRAQKAEVDTQAMVMRRRVRERLRRRTGY
jgi:hypothetical protein